jgi:hypothetical protein
MSDDDRRHDEPDARDERIAAMLEVPPLDDLTRRRLVRRALGDAAPAAPGRRARLLRVAAAAVVGVAVVGGAAALVLRDGGNGNEVADQEAAPATTEEALPAGAPSDLGEVSDPEVLRERLATASPPPAGAPGGDRGSDTETFEEDTAIATGLPPACLDALAQQGAGAPSLVATATFGGVPVFVVEADAAAGETAFVLDQATCAVIRTVSLA